MREIWDNAWAHIWEWVASSSKAHHTVLLLTGITFAIVACRRGVDATLVGAVGGVLVAVYGTNAWAGTRSKITGVVDPVNPAAAADPAAAPADDKK